MQRRLYPSADDDLAVRVLVGGLAPGMTYYYRFRHGSAASPVGMFRTAPDPGTAADVSFAWGGSDTLHQFHGARAQDSTLSRADGALRRIGVGADT